MQITGPETQKNPYFVFKRRVDSFERIFNLFDAIQAEFNIIHDTLNDIDQKSRAIPLKDVPIDCAWNAISYNVRTLENHLRTLGTLTKFNAFIKKGLSLCLKLHLPIPEFMQQLNFLKFHANCCRFDSYNAQIFSMVTVLNSIDSPDRKLSIIECAQSAKRYEFQTTLLKALNRIVQENQEGYVQQIYQTRLQSAQTEPNNLQSRAEVFKLSTLYQQYHLLQPTLYWFQTNVHYVDSETKDTPLHQASGTNQAFVFCRLLTFGFDPKKTNKDNANAMDLCLVRNDALGIDILKNLKIKPNLDASARKDLEQTLLARRMKAMQIAQQQTTPTPLFVAYQHFQSSPYVYGASSSHQFLPPIQDDSPQDRKEEFSKDNSGSSNSSNRRKKR